MNFAYKLGVVGFGNMGRAIVNGAVERGAIAQNQVLICDVDKNKIISAGFAHADSNAEIASSCEYILLAVKPQSADDVLREIAHSLCGNFIISIMAGTTIEHISKLVDHRAEVVRCMPNMPCMYGKGAAALAGTGVAANRLAFVRKLFSATGEVVEVEESLLHAVTCVSGSGPAYFYAFVKAVAESGVQHGLTKETAMKLAVATCAGAAEVLAKSAEPVETLIDRVCSKGGTTIEAVRCFEERGLSGIVEDAMDRCYRRSVQLSEKV